jgi:hypothetical protein
MRSFVAWTFCVIALLFSAQLSAQIVVTKVSNMSFGDQVVGTAKIVTIAPTDSGAAVFNATGMTAGHTLTCSVTTNPINITNGGAGASNRVAVNNFQISGCPATVPSTGIVNGIGVGATVTINASTQQGAFTTAAANFRLVVSTY